MVKIEDPKLNGAELIRELKKTGTSDGKLEFASQVLSFTFRKERRVARADEIIDALEKQGVMPGYEAWQPTPTLTLQKAYTLARTGSWSGPVEEKEVPVEELILNNEQLPEAVAKTAAEEVASMPPPAAPAPAADTVLGLKPVPKGMKRAPGVIPSPSTV